MSNCRFQFVTCVQPAGTTSQDDLLVAHREGIEVVAVADGAGNSRESWKAARHALSALDSLTIEALTNADESLLVRVLCQADREISAAAIGETTVVACILRGDEIIGTSVGDSGAWIITDSDRIDLTAHQRRKPLLGSGGAVPVPFRCNWTDGYLLLATDGLLKYTQPQAICETLRGDQFEVVCEKLLWPVRLRSGGYPDDVAIVVGRRASEEQTGVRREPNRWIYDEIYCGDCGARVPQFRDLAPQEQEIIEVWKKSPPYYPEIAKVTGLTVGQAKSFRIHLKKPVKPKGTWNSQPCPKCGRWLRTPQARQCFHCGADWH